MKENNILQHFKGAQSRFARFEKLNFSNSSFAICVNFRHPWPPLFLYGLLLSLWCFSVIVNYYFQVSFHLKEILYVAKKKKDKTPWLSSFKVWYSFVFFWTNMIKWRHSWNMKAGNPNDSLMRWWWGKKELERFKAIREVCLRDTTKPLQKSCIGSTWKPKHDS